MRKPVTKEIADLLAFPSLPPPRGRIRNSRPITVRRPAPRPNRPMTSLLSRSLPRVRTHSLRLSSAMSAPWHASFPAGKSTPPEISASELAALSGPGKEYIVVDVRRTDIDVSSHGFEAPSVSALLFSTQIAWCAYLFLQRIFSPRSCPSPVTPLREAAIQPAAT